VFTFVAMLLIRFESLKGEYVLLAMLFDLMGFGLLLYVLYEIVRVMVSQGCYGNL
jgi:hypothetical protein